MNNNRITTVVIGKEKSQHLKAQCHRLAGRLGAKLALMAVGHSILKIAYYVLTKQQTYHDWGENYLDEGDREAVQRRAVRRLEQVGYVVALSAAASTA